MSVAEFLDFSAFDIEPEPAPANGPTASQNPTLDLRLALLANGYEPTPVLGKAALATGWRTGEIDAARVEREFSDYPDCVSTGLRTGRLVGIDIDTLDQHDFDTVVRVVRDEIGLSPLRRLGAKGAMLAYQNDTPIGKIYIDSQSPGAGDGATPVRQFEVLGLGSQFVAYGDHPDTGKPYAWIGGGEPIATPFLDLPQVTPAQLTSLADAVAEALKELGHTEIKVKGPGYNGPGPLVDASRISGAASPLSSGDGKYPRRSFEEIKAALAQVPAMTHDDSIPFTSGYKSICNEAGVDLREASAAWLAWAARLTHSDGEALADWEISHIWASTDASRVSAGHFVNVTRGAGFNWSKGASSTIEPANAALTTGSDVDLARYLRRALESRDGKVVFADGNLYRYDRTHWKPYQDHALRCEAHQLDGMAYGKTGKVKLGRSRVDSILRELNAMVADPDFFQSAALGVNCANGFISFDAQGRPTLKPHSRDDRLRHVLPGIWEPKRDWREASLLHGTLLEGCFRDDGDKARRIDLVAEIFGCAALGWGTRVSNPKVFFLHGPGAENGKNQIVDCARALLPIGATSSLEPSDFGSENARAALAGKLLNTTGDLASTRAIESGPFKGAITGDAMMAKRLYQEPFEFRPQALHLIATNGLPPFKGGFDAGLARRIMVIPFTRTIPMAERVPHLAARIAAEESDYLLGFAVDGASRLIRQGGFTVPSSCQEALEEWKRTGDPVREWFAERARYDASATTPTREAYEDFARWAGYDQSNKAYRIELNGFADRVYYIDSRIKPGRTPTYRTMVGLRVLLRPGAPIGSGPVADGDPSGLTP